MLTWSDWTLDTLIDCIAEVRQSHLDTLADWPTDVLTPEP
jgi:putative phosphoserine phosphatase/1-acylglycerol-3-phosphate O-acyltransferase